MQQRLAQIFNADVHTAQALPGINYVVRRDGVTVGFVTFMVSRYATATYECFHWPLFSFEMALRYAQVTDLPLTLIVGFQDALMHWTVDFKTGDLKWVGGNDDNPVALSIPVSSMKKFSRVDWGANTAEYLQEMEKKK